MHFGKYLVGLDSRNTSENKHTLYIQILAIYGFIAMTEPLEFARMLQVWANMIGNC